MWEAFSNILTSEKADDAFHFLTMALFVSIVVIAVLLLLGRKGILKINTKHVRIGEADRERIIIQRQVEAAHEFIMSLEGKITVDKSQYNGYFTKYVLERVYDKVVEWIMFNHISNSPMYIKDKQETLCNLVYMLNVRDEFKTPEFKQRMENWTREIIERLIQVREVYK